MARTSKSEDPASRGQRRVYVLPDELVERIVSYQRGLQLSSEVEAVRRLLDDALKRKDDMPAIAERFVNRAKELRSMRNAAREVLADHPRIKRIDFTDDGQIKAFLESGESIDFHSWNTVTLWDKDENLYDFDLDINYTDGPPAWASFDHKRASRKRLSAPEKLDDDIPF